MSSTADDVIQSERGGWPISVAATLRLLWRIVLRPGRTETGGNKRFLRCCGSTGYLGEWLNPRHTSGTFQ
jgi:hypothetical protein